MRIVCFCLILFLGSIASLHAQNYILYDVKPDDTPQGIAQNEGIDVTELYKYNPDLKGKRNISAKRIVIPKAKSDNFGFIRYRVKQLETLYSISKLYNVSVEDLKAFNPQLYENELKAGEIIRIPAYKLPEKYQNIDFNQSLKNSTFDAFKHIVLPKERKADIIKMYGMTEQTFDSLNKDIYEVQSGQMVKVVPKTTKKINRVNELNLALEFYTVPPRQTMYSLTKEFKINEEVVYKLNPILEREGLKAGMILKLPKKVTAASAGDKIVNLENYAQNFNEKKLALFLPFSLGQFEKDSIDVNRILLRDRALNISLDLYEGVNWAIQHAKRKGIYTDLQVYDTRRNPRALDSLLRRIDISDRDAIIGPLIPDNISVLSKQVVRNQIPVFLPITNYDNSKSNIFNTIPQDEVKAETLITYIDSIRTQEQHLIFIGDSIANATFNKYRYTFPDATFYNVPKTYTDPERILKLLKPNAENWVILETNLKGVAEGVVNNLHNFVNWELDDTNNNSPTAADRAKERILKDIKIRLFTSNQNQAYDDVISNRALCDLNFTVVTASKYNILESNSYIENYKRIHGTIPNRYVLRAFDLTYDILLRLAYNGTLADENSLFPLTEYNENRFGYDKPFMSNLYYNKGLYIIEYLPNFEYKVLNAE